jgi:hypothetical protein
VNEYLRLLDRDETGHWRVHQAAAGLFPSAASCRHWLTCHMREAVAAGAVVKHRGTWHFHPEKLAAVALRVARRSALGGRPTDGASAVVAAPARAE